MPGFTRKISQNKYRSEITTQPKSNKFDYMIDPTFWNISKRFVFSCKNDNFDPTTEKFYF